MKEYPIIMSTDMVRAILEDRKTMTRRVIKPQPIKGAWNATTEHPSCGWFWKGLYQNWEGEDDFFKRLVKLCPYGQVGDRLWVRETWAKYPNAMRIAYKADMTVHIRTLVRDAFHPQPVTDIPKWKPSIHMPRWASRITLENVIDPYPQRLQEITEEDAKAEGVNRPPNYSLTPHYREWFKYLWNFLNTKRGYPWESNPLVWVDEFRRIE